MGEWSLREEGRCSARREAEGTSSGKAGEGGMTESVEGVFQRLKSYPVGAELHFLIFTILCSVSGPY